jgi:hypothetical protein
MRKNVGYAFWGHLADKKYKDGQLASTPDGNFSYSFSIINALLEAGASVFRMYPDRDYDFVKKKGKFAFSSFSTKERWNAYSSMKSASHFVNHRWPDLDLVIMEWRMKTPRNTLSKDHVQYEPDLEYQNKLIEVYTAKKTPIIALDLDYSMSWEDEETVSHVLELGLKRGISRNITLPFPSDGLCQFPMLQHRDNISYVGNRYDRDDDFDKYFGKPNNRFKYNVYGNWLERDRDSKERWPHVSFYDRIQPYQLRDAYCDATTVPLLLKPQYNEFGFMTHRLVEAIVFGSIPLLPIAFESPIQYVPDYLRISDNASMIDMSERLLDRQSREKARREIVRILSELCSEQTFAKKIMNFL